MLLGNFTIDSGIQKTSMSIQTDRNWTKFLSNDTNGLITLVIVRDSKELEPEPGWFTVSLGTIIALPLRQH